MKKFLLPLLAALLLTAGSAQAQTQPAGRAAGRAANRGQQATPEEQASRQTERLTKELALSPDQAGRIQQILLARNEEQRAQFAQRKEQGQHKAKGDKGQGRDGAARGQRGEQMKAEHAKYDAQFKEVLTAEQYTKFSALKDGRPKRDGKALGKGDGKLKAKPGKVKVKTKES